MVENYKTDINTFKEANEKLLKLNSFRNSISNFVGKDIFIKEMKTSTNKINEILKEIKNKGFEDFSFSILILKIRMIIY
jgi:tRNA G26 N,N-dimethylase Trm1